ncbi:MAG: Tol-Pal system protein TolB, partial [Gammaproteobacteria bacterium]|nr:Tol-Pal system protein TolB [Gammaproteobacteria bacterium]
MIRFAAKGIALLSMLLWPVFAHAILTIEITRGVDIGTPIAIVPFGWEGTVQLPQNISDVIEADLSRSGRFAVLPRKDFISLPHEDKDVVFKDWRILKAEALVIGSIRLVEP